MACRYVWSGMRKSGCASSLFGLLSAIGVLHLGITGAAATESTASEAPVEHCAVQVHATNVLDPDEVIPEPRFVGCFDTYSEAVYAGTNGAVRVPADLSPDSTAAEIQAAAGDNEAIGVEGDYKPRIPNSIEVLIGRDWANRGFSGSTLSWFASNKCSSTRGFKAPSMPRGWNDRIGSTEGFSRCDVISYEHAKFGGAHERCGICNLGALNDEVSSHRWR